MSSFCRCLDMVLPVPLRLMRSMSVALGSGGLFMVFVTVAVCLFVIKVRVIFALMVY